MPLSQVRGKLLSAGFGNAIFLDSFFLAGGSDSLEVNAIPSALSQWIALGVFAVVLFFALIDKSKKLITKAIHYFTLLISLFLVMLSGHTYTYTGRQHALIDRWFHFPVQTLSVDPLVYLEHSQYVNEATKPRLIGYWCR